MDHLRQQLNALDVRVEPNENGMEIDPISPSNNILDQASTLYEPAERYPWVKRTLADGTIERCKTAYCGHVFDPVNHNVNVTPFASLSNLEKDLFDQMVKLDCERQHTEMAWRDSVEFHCNRVGLEYDEDFQYELHEMIERVEGRGEMYQKHEEFAAVAQKADNVEYTLHILWFARSKPNVGQARIEINPSCSFTVLNALGVDDIGVAIAILEEAIR